MVPAGPGADRTILPATAVAGVPLLRRLVLAGARAGFRDVRVHDALTGGTALLAGTPARPLQEHERGLARTGHRIVILPANVIPHPRWLRAQCERDLRPEAAVADSSLTTVIETREPDRVLAVAARHGDAGTIAGALGDGGPDPGGEPATSGRFVLTSPADLAAAEQWLLSGLVKQSEGFMSRRLERRISLAVTRRLAGTSVTPDVMTLVSVAIGLAGAPGFLSASPLWQLAGALLFLAHSILDGCDGELARLKFLESRRGAILDFWGDNLVHVAVFACMAVGARLATGAVWPLALGAITIVSTLGAAALVFQRTLLDTVPGAGASFTDRVTEAFGHRDFIYLVIILSAFGRADWFLFAAAVGAPIFLLLLLWGDAARRRA